MTSHWSWIFILNLLLCSPSLAQIVNTMSMASNDTPHNGTQVLTASDVSHKPQVVGPIIAGILIALFIVVLGCVVLLFYLRGSPPADLEGGIDEKAPVSGRKWYSSKTGRFKNDKPKPKLSAVPRYLRVFRRSAGWSDQPVPGTPTVPRSARLVAGDSMVTLSLPPSASPTTKDVFNNLDRSDRRKVQVAAQPIQPIQPLPQINSPAINSPLRYGFTPKLSRDEIVQQLMEKREAVAELEEKSRRHQHQVHGSIDSTSTSSTCVVDEQIEQDITELRQEVKTLEKMLPERAQSQSNYL